MSSGLSLFKNIGVASIAVIISGFGIASEDSTMEAIDALQPERAVIHFADLGGVKSWRAVDDNAIEIQGRNGDWYIAEFWSYCDGIRSANNIGFITEPNGDLNSYSSIYVGRGVRCQFKTFNKIEMPTGE